jgi:sugar lactone lactonase YvrE
MAGGSRVGRRTPIALALAAAALVGTLPGPAGATSSPGRYGVVARGLDNPRGISVGLEGSVYVAEAGRGGSTCVAVRSGRLCEGATGSVTQVVPRRQVVMAGLPSVARGDGTVAIGPADVHARAEFLFAVLGDRTPMPRTLEQPEFGTIQERITTRTTTRRADVSEYEALVDPDGQGVDANPTSLTTDGTSFYAVDAAGNALWKFNQYGVGRLSTVFPDGRTEHPAGSGRQVTYEAVPSAVAIGPDAGVYVSTLTGHPYPKGHAAVYKVADGQPVAVHGGFTAIIDFAFGPDGSVYVLEIAKDGLLARGRDGLTSGRLTRVFPDGSRRVLSGGELRSPGGVAVDADGAVYVTNRSLRPETGQVLRYPPR